MALHYHQGQSAANYLHDAARHVDRSAEGDDESRDIFAHSHLDGLLERNRNRGGRRLGAECREIGRHHRPEQLEGITLHEERGDAVLEYQQSDVEREDYADYLGESRQYSNHLAGDRHIEEYAEDVEREQGDYGSGNGHQTHRCG